MERRLSPRCRPIVQPRSLRGLDQSAISAPRFSMALVLDTCASVDARLSTHGTTRRAEPSSRGPASGAGNSYSQGPSNTVYERRPRGRTGPQLCKLRAPTTRALHRTRYSLESLSRLSVCTPGRETRG